MVLGHFPRACALLAAALVLAACQDDAERLAEHRKRAEAYLEEGKHAEAIIEFKNILQVDPNLADAHHGLAKAFIGEKKIRQAYWELQETVRLDPGNLDARPLCRGLRREPSTGQRPERRVPVTPRGA